MSVYMTEEEQIESIKKWWKKNSSMLMVIISVVLLSVAGYRYWNWHQDKITTQASNAYEQMMVSYSNQDNKSVKSYANQLISNYNKTIYADAAHLLRAKLFVEAHKMAQAKDELKQVISNSIMPPLKQVAKLRLARIMAADKSYDKALVELSSVEDQAYLSVIYELKGDIYSATGKYKQAIQSYRMAMNEGKTTGMGNLFLEMKSNEIASLTKNSTTNNDKKQVASA